MKKFFSFPSFASLALLALPSCSSVPQSAARPDFNFMKIKAIEIRAKDNLSPLISRELLLAGVKALSSSQSKVIPDAILHVVVARENPEKRYVVQSVKKKAQQQTSVSSDVSGVSSQVSQAMQYEEDLGSNPIEFSGSAPPYSQSVWGAPDSRLVAAYAQVSLAGELLQMSTGEVLWAGSYTYEGMDLTAALEGAARGFIRAIPVGANR
ncbi:MAG: hypothetical protein HY747_09155 [Elusimicrobia bacterium]|nr:hypothetical protein [Elusimicrobiota bacterium]